MPTNVNKAELTRIKQTGRPQPLGPTLLAIFRVIHPRQALGLAVGTGIMGLILDRPAREVLAIALAVLLTQFVMGMTNELVDQDIDINSQAPDKPLADGLIAPGTVGFVLFLVLLLSVPAALQNGLLAGLFLLGTLIVGFIHNRALKNGPLSFVGWALTFALYVPFLTFGVWGLETTSPKSLSIPAESTPGWVSILFAALLGITIHFAVAIRDLEYDNRAEIGTLPVLLGARLGARGLLTLTVVMGVIASAGLLWAALSNGLTT
jgi:4-hydroxybenzoate polyprenyltransferase